MSMETNGRAVLRTVASVGLPNRTVIEAGYLTLRAHLKGKDPS